MSSIGQKTQAAFGSLVEGTLNAVEAGGKTISYGADIVKSTGKTAADLVDITGTGTVNATGQIFKAANSGLEIVSSAVGAVATTATRIENSTKEMAKRRAEIERQKTADQVGKTTEEIAKIEARTNLELDRIQKEYELEQQRLKLEQEYNLDRLNSEQREKLLTQKDATNQRQRAYNYGFTKNDPKPTDTGFKQSINFLYNLRTNTCFSYIPKYFVTDDGNIINIDFPKPEEQPTDTRSSIIQVINMDTNQPIQITFQAQAQKDWRGKPIYLQLPVIKFQDSDGQSKTLFGKMYYDLIYFPCGTTIGGRRRRTNKRITNKRRTNRRTNKRRTNRRQRTNKRRTNRRRTNKSKRH